MAQLAFSGEKGKTEAKCLFNSGSNFIVLPAKLLETIGPKYVGETEVELADKRMLERKVYEVEIEIRNDKGKPRQATTYATAEERDYPLIGTMAMEELKVNLDIQRGKVIFV